MGAGGNVLRLSPVTFIVNSEIVTLPHFLHPPRHRTVDR